MPTSAPTSSIPPSNRRNGNAPSATTNQPAGQPDPTTPADTTPTTDPLSPETTPASNPTPATTTPPTDPLLTPQSREAAKQARQARESLRPVTPANNQALQVNPPTGRPYQAADYPNTFAQPVRVVRLTVAVTGSPTTPPTAIDTVADNAQTATDIAFNQGHQFPLGDWLMVDVVPTTNPSTADLTINADTTPTLTDLANTVRTNLGLPPRDNPTLTPDDLHRLGSDISRADLARTTIPSWADQHTSPNTNPDSTVTPTTDTNPETTPDLDTNPPVDLDAIHNNHAEQTPAGVSHHRGDPTMGDLPHRVPADPNRFTADTHITPDGHAIIGGQPLTPEQYGDLLRRSGWDGVSPIRLIGCDASTNGFADRLAQHLGVEVLAPTQAAWTDANGNVFSASTITNPDGTRSPRVPPDGQWHTHHPNGTTTADTNSAVPGSRTTKLDPTTAVSRAAPTGARGRSLDPHAQQIRDEARLRTGGRDALTSNSPARELTRADVERIERIEGLRDDLNRPGIDPAVTRAKLRAELEDAGVLRDGKQVLRNDGPAMERRALMSRAGLDVNSVADEIGLRRPPPARTDNEGLPLRGEHADPAAVPRRDVTFAEVDAIVPDKLINALAKFGVSREVAVAYIVDNHNDRSRQRYLPDLEGLARQYGIPHGDVLVIDLYTTKLYYEELNRRLRNDTDVDSVAELQQAVNDSLSKLPPAAVPELFRSLSIDPGDLPGFLARYTEDAVIDWNAFTSVAGEVGGTWWEEPGENILFEVRGGVAYDISDFADGLHYKDPPNPGRELLLPAGRVVRVESVTPHVLPDGTTGYVIELHVVGSAGPPSAATP
ncbi:hypothetical protein [Nocardia sp. NPDC058705]|uniref:hypothetical protein n=1 Tax=Nocardia sp. NPDC058705 TaxID=3346609 RepID=UPI0036951CA2